MSQIKENRYETNHINIIMDAQKIEFKGVALQ